MGKTELYACVMSGESAHDSPDRQSADTEAGTGPGPRAELTELAAVARFSQSQPLTPIAGAVAPEARELAETLRVLFGALGVSLNRLAALLHSDPGTVSRYLSGKRVPPPDFIESLCKAVYDAKGALVTAQVRELVHEQFLTALREHNPARYEVQRLTDLLQVAAQERQQYQITVTALEEAIASRNEKIYALEAESRQLRSGWARTEGLLENERKHRVHLQETINDLYAQVSHLKDQLLTAQHRAVQAEDRCRQLEARLDAAGALLQQDDEPDAITRTFLTSPELGIPPTDGEVGLDLPETAQRLARGPAVTRQPGWWDSYSDILPDWFQAYIGMEEAAQSIRMYEPQFIPGLLQTEQYATAIIAAGEFPPEQAERLVELRKERQRRFREGTMNLHAILDQTALRRPVAGTVAQIEQLRYLRTACASPTMTLLILPSHAGRHAAPCGFSIMRFADPDLPDVVYVENLTNALYLDMRTDVNAYLRASERLSKVAFEPHKTPDVIDQIIAELETAHE